jgi:hypothetical protein
MVLAKYIRDKYLNRNRNCIIVISGATGTGKSWAGLTIGAKIDKTFNYKSLEKRLCFSQEEFMQRINEVDEDGEFILQKGMVLMYEEAGVSVDSRSWWMNKDLSHIIETFRNRNLIVIFTLPLLKMMDSNVRALTNFSIHTQRVHIDDGVTKTIVKELLINRNIKATDAYITKYIKVGGQKVRHMYLPKPPIKLRHKYESIANKWKYNLSVVKEQNLDKRNNPKVKEKINLESYVNLIDKHTEDYTYTTSSGRKRLFTFGLLSAKHPELNDSLSMKILNLAKLRGIKV